MTKFGREVNDKAIEEINSAQFIGPPVRRYASTVLYLFVFVSVRLSRIGVLLKRLDGSSWFLTRGLHSTYSALYCKEIKLSGSLY